MRDGTRLAGDLYLPAGAGPSPAVVIRTPYDRSDQRWAGQARRLASGGYAVLVQDVRGRGDSEGDWRPFWNEGRDGYDTIEWVAEQSWCTGMVGTMGASYNAWVQWAAARERPPHLAAMVSSAAGGRVMKEWPYCNGMLTLQMLAWLYLTNGRRMQDTLEVDWDSVFYHLPLRTMDAPLGVKLPMWLECVDHPTLGYWKELEVKPEDFRKIDVPTLHVTGWWDGPQAGLFFHNGMVTHSPAADRQRLVIGPWDHEGCSRTKTVMGGIDFAERGRLDFDRLHLDWFNRWLRDGQPYSASVPAARYFLTGINEWQEAPSWPLPERVDTPFYLHSGGRANSLRGDGALDWDPPGDEPSDTYLYDPDDPVIQVLDFDPFHPPIEAPLDRRYVARRSDVLAYTSSPFEGPVRVVGHPSLVLYATSDCPDTDWVATISDVAPSGRSMQLAEGRLRARFRESLEEETLMEAGRVYCFRIELTAVGNVFLPGHRLRLTVTSSDFPIYDRNLNTGRPIADDTEPRRARNTVFHGAERQSHLVLPVIPS